MNWLNRQAKTKGRGRKNGEGKDAMIKGETEGYKVPQSRCNGSSTTNRHLLSAGGSQGKKTRKKRSDDEVIRAHRGFELQLQKVGKNNN